MSSERQNPSTVFCLWCGRSLPLDSTQMAQSFLYGLWPALTWSSQAFSSASSAPDNLWSSGHRSFGLPMFEITFCSNCFNPGAHAAKDCDSLILSFSSEGQAARSHGVGNSTILEDSMWPELMTKGSLALASNVPKHLARDGLVSGSGPQWSVLFLAISKMMADHPILLFLLDLNAILEDHVVAQSKLATFCFFCLPTTSNKDCEATRWYHRQQQYGDED